MNRLLTCILSAGALVAQSANLDWQLEPNPPSRSAHSVTWFGAADLVVMFGGQTGQYIYHDDTWCWNDRWSRVVSAVSPPPRSYHAVAYDALRGRLVLFGGRNRTAVFGDTWVFDGVEWTQLSPPTSPSPRWNQQMVYDTLRDRVVLFGGSTQLGGAGDDALWEFDGTIWQQIPAGTQSGSGLGVFDEALGLTLKRSGLAMWGWDGTAWSSLPVDGLPTPNSVSSLYFDPALQRVVTVNPVVNGMPLPEAFAYDGTGWTSIGTVVPLSTQYRAHAYDPVRGRLVGVQGSQAAGTVAQSHTFVLAAGQWRIEQLGLPEPRSFAMMVYDRQRRRLVLHGGTTGVSGRRDVCEAEDHDWSEVYSQAQGTGTQRMMNAMVYDEADGSTLVVGDASLGVWQQRWTSAGWSLVSDSATLPARWRHCMAYDSSRARSVLFGGESTQSTLLGDCWFRAATGWSQFVGAVPPPRRDAAMCYDRHRDRVVLFGGSDALGVRRDTWEFDGAAWSEVLGTTAPPPRAYHALVYDEHLHRAVLFGGCGSNLFGGDLTADLRDTWLWDGVQWTELVTANRPSVGTGVAMAYDVDRRETIVFGGGSLTDVGGDMWRLRDLDLGNWQSTGNGCDAGSGPLELVGVDAPAIGTAVGIELRNVPSSFVALPIGWIGFDDQQWDGVPLPVSLAALGAPACFVHADARVALPMLHLGNVAQAVMTLPDVPAAVGLVLHLQGAVWDFATSQVATANLLTATIGVP